ARRPRRHGRPPARLAERVVDPLPAPERVAGLVPLLVKRVLPTIQRLVANPVLQAAPELRITIRHERPPMVRRVARLAFPGFPVRRAPLGRRGLLRLQRRLGEVRQLRLRHARLRLLPRPFSRELGRHEPSLLISACSHVRPPALHRSPLRQTALAPSATPCLPLRPLWEIPARSSPPGNNRACRQTGRMYDRSQRRGTLPSRSRPAHPADRQPPHATGQRDAPSVAAFCASAAVKCPPPIRRGAATPPAWQLPALRGRQMIHHNLAPANGRHCLPCASHRTSRVGGTPCTSIVAVGAPPRASTGGPG